MAKLFRATVQNDVKEQQKVYDDLKASLRVSEKARNCCNPVLEDNEVGWFVFNVRNVSRPICDEYNQ